MDEYYHHYGTKKVLIFGATGMLGREVVDQFQIDHGDYPHWYVRTFNGDITNYQKVKEAVENITPDSGKWGPDAPDVVINCAAMTNVDECEKNPQKAYAVNAVGPKNIATACIVHNVPLFIHLSTDYVFAAGGFEGCIHPIADTRKDMMPVNQYGLSKLAGEKSIANEYYTSLNAGLTNGEYKIVRTSRLYGKYRYNFVDYVCDLCFGKVTIDDPPKFSDGNITVPTSAKGLAHELWNLANGYYHDYYDGWDKKNVFHCVNPFKVSTELPNQYEYAETIYRILAKNGLKPNHYFEKISCRDWNKKAKKEGKAIRPYSSVLEPSSPVMFEYCRGEDNHFIPYRWDESLEYYIKEKIKNGSIQ